VEALWAASEFTILPYKAEEYKAVYILGSVDDVQV
jgi:hypothetical protein